MTLQTLQSLLEDVVTAHKSDVRFFTGLESDFKDSSDVKYPAIHVLPVGNSGTITNNQTPSQTWAVIMEYHTIVPNDATKDAKNEAMQRSNQILWDIIFKLADLGSSGATVTYNNVVTKLDYSLPLPSNMTAFVDIAPDNTTGWQVIFSIVEDNAVDFCCTEAAFNTLTGI